MKWMILCIALVAVISYFVANRSVRNVCKTFQDYYTNRDENENCYYNPDYNLSAASIIRRHGYKVETHKVYTADGYILTLFRIPHGKNIDSGKLGKPVFIQHGITINSGAFLIMGKKSLGFILADAGYDVWLGNFRGSIYSREHISWNATDSKFWDFSFHELGMYDLPAQLNFVNDITKQKIIYIGFSMGSTASYVYGVTYPELAYEKVEIFISLAPIAFMKSLWPYRLIIHFWPLVRLPLQALTQGQFMPRPALSPAVFNLVCLPFPFQMEICQIPDMLMLGYNYEQNDPETLPVTLQHNRDATSLKTITHYTQLMHSENFQYFDYGTAENKKQYGASTPPHYNLSQMKVPNYLIRAPNDYVSTKENVEKLHSTLPNKANPYDIYVIEDERFTHVDCFTGKDAVSLVYKPIVKFIDDIRLK